MDHIRNSDKRRLLEQRLSGKPIILLALSRTVRNDEQSDEGIDLPLSDCTTEDGPDAWSF